MKIFRFIGFLAVALVALSLILMLIMGFFARRQGTTIRNLIQQRIADRRISESQDLTSGSFSAGMNSFKLTSGGITRTGLLYLPKGYDGTKAMPLVIGYHGGFGLGENQEKLTHMSEVADKEGFIILYPDGIQRHWNDGRTKEGGATADTGEVDDVQFTKNLIATTSTKFTIDSKRIYATGISNGGMMTYRLACEMTNTFAAIAPVSSGLPTEYQPKCQPAGPIPILMMQGTSDPLIPFDGGQIQGNRGAVLPTRETLTFWITNNKASTTPVTTELPDTSADGTTVTHESYQPSDATGAPVEFYLINNGGHTWAGGNQYAPERFIGKTNRDVDASELIWDFFKQYSRP